MSLALAKKSMRLFDIQEDSKQKLKKKKKSTEAPSKTSNTQDEKIQKLLLLNSSSLDKTFSKQLIKAVTSSSKRKSKRNKSKEKSEKQKASKAASVQEGVFTEEDFANFAEELELKGGHN